MRIAAIVLSCVCLAAACEGAGPSAPRHTPPHRAEAIACEAPPPRDGEACINTFGGPDTADMTDCESDLDCPDADSHCLAAYAFGFTTACQCRTNECLFDDDCGAGALCECGMVETPFDTGCGAFHPQRCLHGCLPADCRTDADCAPGGLCSPSMDDCGLVTLSYHCHDPSVDECFSDHECDGGRCVHRDGGWVCVDPGTCD